MADPIRQLLSQTSYDADGTTTVWNFSFAGGYLDREHVKVQVMDKVTLLVTQIPISDTNFIGDYQLQLIPAVEVGQELTIYRDSPKDLPLVDFSDRAALTEAALDLNAKQAIFASAEVTDTVSTSLASVSQVGAQVAAAEGYAADAAGHVADAANQVLLAAAQATQANASAVASSSSAQSASDSAAAAAASAESVDTAFLLNRANHTGTQDASTVLLNGIGLDSVLPALSTGDRDRANHTGTQDASTVLLSGVGLNSALPALSTGDRNRANHTGTQAQSTVDGLPADLAALQGRQLALGDGQTRQNVTGSRASGTIYTNSTGRTILATCSATAAAAGNYVVGRITGFGDQAISYAASIGQLNLATLIVRAGESYSFTVVGGTGISFYEIR